ncbi:MAG: CPBP family intramembrane glutamic endopeptidase [Thermodesulfobacteriota bacterium]
MYLVRFAMAFRIIPLVCGLALASGLYLARCDGFDRAMLWNTKALRRQLAEMLRIFLPLALVLTVAAWHFLPRQFLAFPRTRPFLWGLVMLLYPAVMVYPQELVFRAFFFQRYRPLFADDRHLILVNAVSFGIAHAVYGNWLAPVLSGFGGILFGWRYLRSQSLLATSIEHALWGNLLFTAGFGWYFYSGAIR